MSDYSEPTIANFQVAEKYSVKHRRRKGGTYHTYHIKLNNALEPIESPMKISHGFYNTINENDWVSFTIREGRLDKPWLENMYKCIFCTNQLERNDF